MGGIILILGFKCARNDSIGFVYRMPIEDRPRKKGSS